MRPRNEFATIVAGEVQADQFTLLGPDGRVISRLGTEPPAPPDFPGGPALSFQHGDNLRSALDWSDDDDDAQVSINTPARSLASTSSARVGVRRIIGDGVMSPERATSASLNVGGDLGRGEIGVSETRWDSSTGEVQVVLSAFRVNNGFDAKWLEVTQSRVSIIADPFGTERRLYPTGANAGASGWTSASGWSVTIHQCRPEGAHAWISGTVERTGANITVSNPAGDIGNQPIAFASGTPANGNSNTHWGIPTGSTGRLCVITFNPSTGQLTLCAVAPGANITTGEVFSFAGGFPTHVGS